MRRRIDVATSIGFLCTLGVLIASVYLSFRNTRHLRDTEARAEHAQATVNLLEATLSTLKDAETGQRGFIITGEEPYLEPYDTALARIHSQLDELTSLTLDQPTQVESLVRLRAAVDARLASLRQSVELRRQPHTFERVREMVASGRGKAEMDEVRRLTAQMQATEREELHAREELANAAYRTALVSNLFTGAAAIGLLCAVFLVVRRNVVDRKRAAQQALEERERYRVTLSSIGDAVIVTDEHGQVTFLNGVAEELTGWKREAHGHPLSQVFRIVQEETGAPAEDPVAKVLRDGKIVGLANHTILIAKDGARIPIDDSAAPIRTADDRIAGVVLVFRDMRDRRTSANKLEASEHRFRNMANVAPVLIWVASSDKSCSWFNKRWLDFVGRPLEQELGRGWIDNIHPDDLAHVMRLYDEAFDARQTYTMDYRLRRHDGEYRDIFATGTPQFDAAGAFTGYIGTCIDITEEKRKERALRESERIYRAIGESIDYGIWICDAQGRAVYVSDSFLRLVGSTQEQCTEFGWTNALHPDEAQRTLEAWKECVRTGGTWDIEHRFRGVDGAWHPVLARGVPVRNERGEITAWAGINLDISRQKEVETALREADQRKNEFLATLAHELRNPLAPIRTTLHLISAASDDRELVHKTTTMMERQVVHMVRLIDDLMDVSRITRNTLELRPEMVALALVVRDAIETSRPLIEGSDQKLEVVLPERTILVRADPVRLAQVFANLLNNAAKFTPRGGNIELAVVVDDNQAVITVTDNGVGMPAAILGRVFDMFTQGANGVQPPRGGLGIGLTLVKRIVELHHGTVKAESPGYDRGSTFTVRIPIEAITESSKPSAQPAAARVMKVPRRVLVVEDSPDGAESLTMLLRVFGHEVEVARDGEEAIQTALLSRPEVVLLDLGLPKIDGYGVATRILEEPWGRNVLLVALTGWGQPADRARTKAAGFRHHLVKPVDPAQLEQLIARG